MNIQISQVLERMKEYWDTIPQQYMVVIYLAGAVFALLNCFMGYRLRKVWAVSWEFWQEPEAAELQDTISCRTK